MVQTQKELPGLVKQSDIFKIVIPKEVEDKIRHLCRCCPTVEWSGKLFYKTEGSIENKDLVVTCVDLYVMDIGSSTFTEFDETPDYLGYMVDKDLMDTNVGLIHSHNNMATFFSGTDTQTLREEGNENNHFVSLIVNNAGNYTAAVTRKVNIALDITAVKSYRTFDDSLVEIEGEEKYKQNSTKIEYYMLDIDKEEAPNVYNELDARLNEIRTAKEAKAKKDVFSEKPKSVPSVWNDYKGIDNLNSRYYHGEYNDYYNRFDSHSFTKEEKYKQPTLFDEEELAETNSIVSPELVEDIALRLITGSIVIDSKSKIDIDKFAESMEALYDKRFGKDEDHYTFKEWIDVYIDFLINEAIPMELAAQEETEFIQNLCSAVYDRINELPENTYILDILDNLVYRIDFE